MTKQLKVLILGGYGVFGGRLAQLLHDVPEVELLVAGRDRARAEAFCASYRGHAKVRPVLLDRADISTALRAERPGLVVDASGPFQDYGADPYGVIAACIGARVDYLDFADAADFVFGVSQFDARARAAGVFVLSGVSSFPVLTAAVLREMAKTMDIASVEGGIAPSPYAGIGLNVMRAVIGYAGSPVKLVRNGKPSHGVGLAESKRFTIAPPGRLPLRNIRFSLVDVPDLLVIPPEHPTMTDIWMGAGPVPEILHRLLNLLALLRHALRLPSLKPFSGLFYAVLNGMKFGEHRGGMFVRARGVAAGREAERSWHLLAEGDDGPFIPSMAIEAIVRNLVAGERPPAPGARPAIGSLNLEAYDKLFRGRQIFTGFREHGAGGALYPAILGSAFETLPPRLRALHGTSASRQLSGTASVERGRGILPALVAALFRFPVAAPAVPVTVSFQPEGQAERWTRDFGGRRFSSLQSLGRGRDAHLLVERFGWIRISLALVVEGERLLLIPRRWSLLGISMPRFLLPTGSSFETERNGQFCFDVEIALPVIGRIVAYRGTLDPANAPVPVIRQTEPRQNGRFPR